MSKIKFEKINKVYDNGFQAVFNFDLEVNDGEFIVFVGPSGCGKSTMIRIIAGLEEITQGSIYFDDVLMNHKSPDSRGIAMVFQSYALYPHLNVYENMAFALTLEGYDEDFVDKRVKEVAAVLGLDTMLDRKPRQLSGGQCQRVAVGRAIIRHPKVFLMDEPLSNLDAKQRVSMRSEIIEIHRRVKATTIYVTHDQVEAMTMADKIVVMCDGRIQQAGTPRELYFKPQNKFVAGFMGDPPMNFLTGKIESGIFSFDGQKADLRKVFPRKIKELSGDITLGFRPEAAEVAGRKDAGDMLQFAAETELGELLGDTANLYALIGDTRITVKVPMNYPLESGAELNFCVPHKDIYLFDGKSTRTIYDIDD